MKFGYTIVYVENVVNTVAFYEKAFGLKQLFVHESNQYAEMDTGSTKLAFASLEMAKVNGVEINKSKISGAFPPFEIALVTDDVETAFKTAIAHGAAEVKKPAQKPWGQFVGYVKDYNGFLIEICSPME